MKEATNLVFMRREREKGARTRGNCLSRCSRSPLLCPCPIPAGVRVCAYVCIYAGVCVRMCVFMCEGVCVLAQHLQVCMRARVCVCVGGWVCGCVGVWVCVCVCVCVCVFIVCAIVLRGDVDGACFCVSVQYPHCTCVHANICASMSL